MSVESLPKAVRILSLYERLCQGEVINRHNLAEEFGVDPKTIFRDLDELRHYFASQYTVESQGSIEYNRLLGGHVLQRDTSSWLTEQEVLALTKVLLESRAFPKQEMDQLMGKLISHCSPTTRKIVNDLVSNEQYHYVPVLHNQPLFNKMWDLSNAISQQLLTEIHYQREGASKAKLRLVQPLAIIFSEYYFYLLAGMEGRKFDFPTVFRLDRIVDHQVTETNFKIRYAERFEEGIFRKQVQFMQTGKLIKVCFKFWGTSLEAILDRLPNAKVLKEEDGVYVIEAETFGRGILMWLLSQGPQVEVLTPLEFRQEMFRNIKKMFDVYQP